MPQATTAASHPQPIAPAPTANRGPPVLRPMPPGGVLQQNINNGYQQPGGNNMLPVMPPITTVLQEENGPTHVVGSQGRRGILPSAPGRPAAPQAGSGNTKSAVIPVKDADGKFPCPHCTKTYLHAKHLKRHLLRRELIYDRVNAVPFANTTSQTPVIALTCAFCAVIPSLVAIS